MPRKKGRNQNKAYYRPEMYDSDEEVLEEAYNEESLRVNMSDIIVSVNEKKRTKDSLFDKLLDERHQHNLLTEQLNVVTSLIESVNRSHTTSANTLSHKLRDLEIKREEAKELFEVEESKLVELEEEANAVTNEYKHLSGMISTVTTEITDIKQQLQHPYLHDEIQRTQTELLQLQSGQFEALSMKACLALLNRLTGAMGNMSAALTHSLNRAEEETVMQCEICFNAPRNAVVMPCKHYLMCLSCANAMKQCPFCLEKISRVREVLTS
jgi:rubrerythrin